jgi:YkgG family uncharacterized protein
LTAEMTAQRYAQAASSQSIDKTKAALEAKGINVFVVDTPEAAKGQLLKLIPQGASVGSGASVTLDESGITAALDSGAFDYVRTRATAMDRQTQADEIRRLLQTPDYMVGSAHAVTEDGSLLFGSMGGSQIGPYASGAGKVLWVVGSQKIVPNVDEGLKRLREYSLVLESERARKAYGIPGSALNNILIINGSVAPGRLTVILVRQPIGF